MPEVLGSKVIVSIRPARLERLGEELFGSVRLTAQIVGHEPGIKGSPGAAPDGIQVESLYPTPIICIARRDHPLATVRSCRLSDLADHRIAAHSWGPEASELDAALADARIPPTRICWVSPSATALALAVEHGYVAVLPADAARAEFRTGTVAPVRLAGRARWSLNVSVAYRRRSIDTGPVAIALRALRALRSLPLG